MKPIGILISYLIYYIILVLTVTAWRASIHPKPKSCAPAPLKWEYTVIYQGEHQRILRLEKGADLQKHLSEEELHGVRKRRINRPCIVRKKTF